MRCPVASDQRWTGGLANRGWQSGTRLEPVVDKAAILAQVRAYLTDCRRYQAILSPKYHPTEDSAVKVVFGPDDVIRAAYRHLTTARAAAAQQD